MSMVADATLRQLSVPLNPQLQLHRALEESVYAAPSLLADYGKVDIVVRTTSYTLLPPDLGHGGCEAAASIAHIAGEGDVVLYDNTDVATVAWSISADTDNFLSRTFRNAPVCCHISPLLSFLGRRSRQGNSGKLFVHFPEHCNEIDFAAFSAAGRLLAAGTQPYAADNDILYFTLSVAKTFGLDITGNDEVLLCGDSAARMRLMPLLKRYIPHAMPLIFPSAALKAGIEAFKAPFPLIILPLCE